MSIREVAAIVVKLLVASLVVGLVLRALNIQPRNLLRDIPDVVYDAYRTIVHLLDWALPYIMVGAVVVVPIWALVMLFRLVKRR